MNFLLSELTVFTVVSSESSYTFASVSQELTPTGSGILTGCCTWLSTVSIDYGGLDEVKTIFKLSDPKPILLMDLISIFYQN